MKFFISFLLVFSFSFCSAQNFLAPYLENGLYGLVNEKGKVMVKAQFDDVNWLSGRYFKTVRSFQAKDTIEMSPGRFFLQNDLLVVTGLFYGTKEILKDEPFSRYEIVPNKCIIAKSEKSPYQFSKKSFEKYGDKKRFYALFDLEGNNVYPRNFRSLQLIDSTGSHASLNNQARFLLFAAEQFPSGSGFFVYDVLEQKIAEWLVEDLQKVKLIGENERERTVTFATSDRSGLETRYRIKAGANNFSIEKLPVRERNEKQANRNAPGKFDGVDERAPVSEMEYSVVTRESGDNVAVPEPPFEPRESELEMRKRFQPLYVGNKDSLFRLVFKDERKFIPLPANHKIIFLRGSNGSAQFNPVITRSGSKFFLADSSGVHRTGYDSMVYFGSDYLVWKKQGGKWLCGTINKKGEQVIPLVYDSIFTGMSKMQFKSHTLKDSTSLEISKHGGGEPTLNPYARSITRELPVYRNGLMGLLSPANDTLLPVGYDLIVKNELDFFRPKSSGFIITKKKGLYGLAKIEHNNATKQQDVVETVKPAFPFIPLYELGDYYGIKGFSLYGLYDEGMKFQGLGKGDGSVIVKKADTDKQ